MTTRSLQKLVLRTLGFGVLALSLTYCGKSDSDSEDNPPAAGSCDSSQANVASATYSALYETVFKPQCSSCHGVGYAGTEGGPNMGTAASFYSGVVNKKASDYPAWDALDARTGCHPYNFIKSSDANQSLITAILDSSVTLTGCTPKFHRDAPQSVCITTYNLGKMKEWINAGAVQ